MWGKALEIASRMTLPIPVVSFALVFAAFVFWLALRSKTRGTSKMFLAVSLVIVVLGLAPLAASTYLHARGIYRVSIEVLGPDKQPVPNAEVRSLPAAQIKKTDGTWELDIPPQIRPADGSVALSASVESEFLAGSTTIVLRQDYYPKAIIQLAPLPSVVVRGIVLDQRGRPISGVRVAIEGYPEITNTNEMGNFEIASHHANRQMVTVIAQKDGLFAKKSGPTGDSFELVLR